MKRACLVYAWLFLGAVTFACGETRKLELFEKEPKPEPTPPEACAPPSTCAPVEPPPCPTQPCTQCSAGTDCTGGPNPCVDGQCVECLTNEQCPMKKVCNPGASQCTEPCSTMEECKEKGRPVCDVSRGFCVQCTSDANCEKNHVCDTALDMCVGCKNDLDCGDAGTCDNMRHECAPKP